MGGTRPGRQNRCWYLSGTSHPFSFGLPVDFVRLKLALRFDTKVLPLIIPLTFFFLIPRPSAFTSLVDSDPDVLEDAQPRATPYTPLSTSDDTAEEGQGELSDRPEKRVSLSASDKWVLAKPLLARYMLPLCEPPLSSVALVWTVCATFELTWIMETKSVSI